MQTNIGRVDCPKSVPILFRFIVLYVSICINTKTVRSMETRITVFLQSSLMDEDQNI